jgi:hypothetical protein
MDFGLHQGGGSTSPAMPKAQRFRARAHRPDAERHVAPEGERTASPTDMQPETQRVSFAETRKSLNEHSHHPARHAREERETWRGDDPAAPVPRLKNLYHRRAERLRELAENNPLGDYLRFAALIAHAQEVVLYDHPLEMDLTARIKEASEQGKPPLDSHVLPRDKHWQTAAAFADCRAEAGNERPGRWR